jgi:hypothetical protein
MERIDEVDPPRLPLVLLHARLREPPPQAVEPVATETLRRFATDFKLRRRNEWTTPLYTVPSFGKSRGPARRAHCGRAQRVVLVRYNRPRIAALAGILLLTIAGRYPPMIALIVLTETRPDGQCSIELKPSMLS